MIAGGLKAQKPWDEKGCKPEGAARVFSPAGFQLWPAANALYRKETYDNYPGARDLLQVGLRGAAAADRRGARASRAATSRMSCRRRRRRR